MSNTFSVLPYQIKIPERIQWMYPPNIHVDSILENIKSDSSQKFLKNIDDLLIEKNISWNHTPMSESEYIDWLPYYNEKMSENNHEMIANEKWYGEKVNDGFDVESILVHLGNQLVGSAVITRKGTTLASQNFKASDRLNLSSKSNSSIGLVIDYLYLRKMKELGVQSISAGRSRNNFTNIYSTGYLEFKFRFGYWPELAKSTQMLDVVELSDLGDTIFFGKTADSNQLKLYLLCKKEVANEVYNKYQSELKYWEINQIIY